MSSSKPNFISWKDIYAIFVFIINLLTNLNENQAFDTLVADSHFHLVIFQLIKANQSSPMVRIVSHQASRDRANPSATKKRHYSYYISNQS